MVYSLLFPHGEFGWIPNIGHNPSHASAVRNKITPLQFYASKIAYRPKTFQAILRAKHLFQQYIVDFAVKIRESNLQFIRDPKNQAE